MSKSLASAAIVLAGLVSMSQPVQAAWTGASNAWANNPAVFDFGYASLGQNYVYDASVAGLSGSWNFSGINSGGDAASMTYAYFSQAQATSTTLKAYAWAQLTDGFYNAENPAYMLGFDTNWFPIIDPNGVPTALTSSGTAFYQQKLSVAGSSNLAYVTFDVQVDGSKSGTPSSNVLTWATLDFRNGNTYVLSDQTNFSPNSGRFNVSNGVANLEVMLSTSVVFNLEGDTSFSSTLLQGEANFFNTATIGTFYGFDALGNPVDLTSVSTSDGHAFSTYHVASVPEPETWMMLLGGLGLIGGLARRRAARKSA